jgi:hypothetical protein
VSAIAVRAEAVDDPVLIAAGLSLLAGTVHAGLTPHHFAHSVVLGTGFAAAAIGQTAWTAAARHGVSERLARAGIALNLAILVAYLVSRTVGLPWGPHEPFGVLDVLTAAVEGSLCILLLGRVRYAQTAALASSAALVCLLASGMAGH